MTEEAKPKKPQVTAAQLLPLLQEMCHFAGQERLLDKHDLPRMKDAHTLGKKNNG